MVAEFEARGSLPASSFEKIILFVGGTMEFDVTHINPASMHLNPAFSQAVAVVGSARTIYVGGQNAVSGDGKVVGIGDLAAQTEQAFANLRTVLGEAGADLHDIVKWTIYVVGDQDL